MSIDQFCIEHFINELLTDIGVGLEERLIILGKLAEARKVYEANKPTNTISDIANELYQCVRPNISDSATITAQEISKTLFYIVIATAIFVILIVIVLMLLDSTMEYGWIIGLSIYFSLIYIAVVFVLAFGTGTNISNVITSSELDIQQCVVNATNELDTFIQTQDNAISLALCSYFPPVTP